MFGAMNNGANAYAKVGMETGVTAATPHKLITMLFDGAIVAVGSAIQHMQANRVADKGQAISKAILIIDSGLRTSLDKSVGGALAQNLDSLYEYMSNRLVIANLRNEQPLLEEVHNLLKGLRDAWASISPEAAPSPAQPVPAANRDTLAPQAPSRLLRA